MKLAANMVIEFLDHRSLFWEYLLSPRKLICYLLYSALVAVLPAQVPQTVQSNLLLALVEIYSL